MNAWVCVYLFIYKLVLAEPYRIHVTTQRKKCLTTTIYWKRIIRKESLDCSTSKCTISAIFAETKTKCCLVFYINFCESSVHIGNLKCQGDWSKRLFSPFIYFYHIPFSLSQTCCIQTKNKQKFMISKPDGNTSSNSYRKQVTFTPRANVI